MLPADKSGDPIMPTLEQARALLKLMVVFTKGEWAHLSIPLFVLVAGWAYLVIELLMWLFTGAPLTGVSCTLLLRGFYFIRFWIRGL